MSYETIPQEDREQEEEFQSFNKVKYWLFGILSLPLFYYLFVYLPTNEPTKVQIPRLNKYSQLPIHLIPSSPISSQLSVHESYHSLKDIEKEFGISPNSKPSKRLILIGDIHGSYASLISLTEKLNYTSDTDSVIMLGDFLSKGPDSLKVLDYALGEQWFGVLGNHELAILSKYNNFQDVTFKDNETYSIQPSTGKFDKELYIARKLTPDHIDYISSMPLVLNIGPSPFQNSKKLFVNPVNGVASHLGLSAGVSPAEQNVEELLNIDKGWYRDYNSYEKSISKKNRNVVFYGHHASVGLKLKKYTRGLDSGCVYGGELSAMVIWVEDAENNGVVYKQEVVSVKC